MASSPANDVYTWVPPTPAAVLLESGYTAPLAGVGGFAGNGYNYGWTCQTYLPLGTAGVIQTYAIEAPEEPEQVEEAPSPGRSAKNSNKVTKVMKALQEAEK